MDANDERTVMMMMMMAKNYTTTLHCHVLQVNQKRLQCCTLYREEITRNVRASFVADFDQRKKVPRDQLEQL